MAISQPPKVNRKTVDGKKGTVLQIKSPSGQMSNTLRRPNQTNTIARDRRKNAHPARSNRLLLPIATSSRTPCVLFQMTRPGGAAATSQLGRGEDEESCGFPLLPSG